MKDHSHDCGRDSVHEASYGGALTLLTMPDDGIEAVCRLIEAATTSLDLKIFEFQSEQIVAAVIAAAKRGIAVRVLMNAVRSSGERPNDATLAQFTAAGIAARWSSPHFLVTHEKSMVVDGRRALISTFNFSDKYFSRTRDYGLVVEDAALVGEIGRCFEADWAGEVFEPVEPSAIAWGNVTARRSVAAFIDGAKHRLLLQHPKFRDAAILDRVLLARERGVHVRYLCGGRHGIEVADLTATFAYQRILARAGVKLRKQHGLKLHAKMMIADDACAFVGSMNIDRDAYDIRRELGLAFTDPAAVAALVKRFHADWEEAKHYEARDPVEPGVVTAYDPEAAADPDGALRHE